MPVDGNAYIRFLSLALMAFASLGGLAMGIARRPGRDPRTLLVTTTDGIEPATFLKARFPLWFESAVTGSIAVLFGVIALTHDDGRAIFLPLTSYLAGRTFCLTSGRIGDRTIVFTRDRVRQHAGGLEQSVLWADVTHVTRAMEALDLHASAVEIRRTAPWLFSGRGRRMDGAMRLQLEDVPESIAIVDALLTWREEPWRRAEIGTGEAVTRLVRRPDPA